MAHYVIAALLTFITSAACAQYNKASFNQLFLAAISYQAVVRVCEDRASQLVGERVIRRVLNYGEHNNLLSYEARNYMKNSELILARGEARYRIDRYVGCGQARSVMLQLDDISKQLP